jgi:hypothetical protein
MQAPSFPTPCGASTHAVMQIQLTTSLLQLQLETTLSVLVVKTLPLTAHSVSLGETPPLTVWHVCRGCINQVTEQLNVSQVQLKHYALDTSIRFGAHIL